jgi:hypothetical protein
MKMRGAFTTAITGQSALVAFLAEPQIIHVNMKMVH